MKHRRYVRDAFLSWLLLSRMITIGKNVARWWDPRPADLDPGLASALTVVRARADAWMELVVLSEPIEAPGIVIVEGTGQ